MHTYRPITDYQTKTVTYSVGYWLLDRVFNDDYKHIWQELKRFDKIEDAEHYVSGLNGGSF